MPMRVRPLTTAVARLVVMRWAVVPLEKESLPTAEDRKFARNVALVPDDGSGILRTSAQDLVMLMV